MIDYLTPLLEEAAGLAWQEAVLLPAAARDDPDRPPWETAPAAPAAALPQADRPPRPEEPEPAADDPARAALPPESAAARQLGAALLDQRLRRTGRVSRLAQAGGSALALRLPEPAPAAAAPTLLDLDRAVQRDARRYDGGFTLY